MVWDINAKYKAESKKIVWEAAPYLRGRGLDIGCGSFKVLPQAVGIDNGNDMRMFSMPVHADVPVEDATDLGRFGSQQWDFVYSSHLLEHLDDPQRALKEWWRLLRPKGHLVLYLPHKDLYPRVGAEGANPDHKHDLDEQLVIGWMRDIGFWDLKECQVRDQDDEYSFFLVFEKREVRRHDESWQRRPEGKTACVVRYGAFGDMMMASTVWAGLKRQGYHVTVFASPPGADVITHDPNIDRLVLFEKDQVPNADLGAFWDHHKKKYDKWVNLSESVEGTLLAMPGRSVHGWAPLARHTLSNHNYVQVHHEIAGLPHEPVIKFYATPDEKEWARKERRKISDPFHTLVMWSLAGSSVHKTWDGLDNILATIMLTEPTTKVVLVGGPEGQLLEQGWQNEPRILKRCGKWSIRETLAFLAECDIVIGPETGVLNAASMMDLIKIVFLSHSTHQNLTRDWRNVIALASDNTSCPGRGANEAPACHQMHYGWDHCKKVEERGIAQCQADISVETVWKEVDWALQAVRAKKLGVTVEQAA